MVVVAPAADPHISPRHFYACMRTRERDSRLLCDNAGVCTRGEHTRVSCTQSHTYMSTSPEEKTEDATPELFVSLYPGLCVRARAYIHTLRSPALSSREPQEACDFRRLLFPPLSDPLQCVFRQRQAVPEASWVARQEGYFSIAILFICEFIVRSSLNFLKRERQQYKYFWHTIQHGYFPRSVENYRTYRLPNQLSQ